MNDKRKEYLKKWREDNKEHISNYRKEYAKTHDSSFKKLQNKYKQLQEENKQLKEVIDNAIEYINKCENIKAYYEYIDEDGYDEYNYEEDFKKELLDILKEVKTC